MVLDSGMEIYVWVGKDSTEDEQKAGFKMAQVFITINWFSFYWNTNNHYDKFKPGIYKVGTISSGCWIRSDFPSPSGKWARQF